MGEPINKEDLKMLDKKYYIHENKIAKVLDAKSIVKYHGEVHDIISYHVIYGSFVIKHVVLTYSNNKLIKTNGEIMIDEIEKLKIIE